MWWAEHAIMGLVFGGFALWLLWKRNFSWFWAAALSQVPFWVGFLAVVLGDPTPVNINLAMNLIAAGLFIDHGHKLQLNRRGGVVHVWLCGIFLVAATGDVLQLLYPMPVYVLTQELFHYMALIVIGGRAYVKRFDGSHRNRRYMGSVGKSGELV